MLTKRVVGPFLFGFDYGRIHLFGIFQSAGIEVPNEHFFVDNRVVLDGRFWRYFYTGMTSPTPFQQTYASVAG